jgi:hypothetical protein
VIEHPKANVSIFCGVFQRDSSPSLCCFDNCGKIAGIGNRLRNVNGVGVQRSSRNGGILFMTGNNKELSLLVEEFSQFVNGF